MGQKLQREDSAVAHRPWRWTRRLTIASAALAAAVIVALVVVLRLRRTDCAAASRFETDSTVVVVCQREYESSREPSTGAELADAYRRSGNLDAAVALANELLVTDARANALGILGKVAYAQHRPEDGVRFLQEARELHRRQGSHLGLARDDQYLGMIQSRLTHYTEALQTLEEGIVEASTAGDASVEGVCHLTAARVLIDIGYFEAAHEEMDRAGRQLSTERDLAQLWFMKGNLEQEADRGLVPFAHQRSAVAMFERSLEIARRRQITSLILSLDLNLAYSLAEIGRTDDAERHLAEAAVLDRDRTFESTRAQLAARIAYRRGNHELAYTLNERQFPSIKDEDEQIDVCVMQARIALASGDPTAAATWATRGVDVAEKMRADQQVAELRPWVLASRREPFEVLFAALARAGRVQQAVEVFDRWHGRTLLDDVARPSPEPSPRLSSAATRVQSLGRWLPVVSRAPLMSVEDRAIGPPLAEIDLIALVVAEGDLWRLAASHGKLALDDLGTLDALRDRLERFTAAPTESADADALGALILPANMTRKSDEPLYVVLDAQFAALPFVALRRDGEPVIAARPVIRAPRIPTARRCEPRGVAGSARPVVLADAFGDLPEARREASEAATRFGATPLVGADATSAALFAARSVPFLHVAVHADVDVGGGVLRLHDRGVTAPEILASKLAPWLVVLSGCNTARSRDPELAGSLATAFLGAGSRYVVATLRDVTDPGALGVSTRFYDAGGADDPVRALARIQADLFRTGNQDWANFAVFGTDVCMSPR